MLDEKQYSILVIDNETGKIICDIESSDQPHVDVMTQPDEYKVEIQQEGETFSANLLMGIDLIVKTKMGPVNILTFDPYVTINGELLLDERTIHDDE